MNDAATRSGLLPERGHLQRAMAAMPWLSTVAEPDLAGPPGGALRPFALADVRLLGGPFKRAQELDGRYLLSLNVDRLLHHFRLNAGLPTKAPEHEGRESEDLGIDLRDPGHTLGHYLSACSMMWAATGDAEFRRRAEYIVRELQTCQKASGHGLVCAFPDGDPQAVIGGPGSTLREVAAGLRDAHVHVGSTSALAVLRRLVDSMGEAAPGCCEVRLQQTLFSHGPRPAYADWAERALINGVLASQDPQSGMGSNVQPLRLGDPKLDNTPEHLFGCCTGTGMENHARYGETIYFAEAQALYVSQYLASDLNWRERGLRISQVTAFPERATSRLLIRAERSTRWPLRLRHPAWCRVLSVKVNGQAVAKSYGAGSWLEIDRPWHNGDVVDINLPMHLHLAPLPNAPDIAAILWGPMVLAARMGSEGVEPGAELIGHERTCGELLQQPMVMPKLDLEGRALEDAIRPLPGDALRFKLHAAEPDQDFELVPYHRIAHERCSLYWQICDRSGLGPGRND